MGKKGKQRKRPIPNPTAKQIALLEDDYGLSDRQRAFVEAYLTNGFIPSEAAIAAGYSPKNPSVSASSLIHNPKVANVILKRFESQGITREEIQIEVARLAKGKDFEGQKIATRDQIDALKFLAKLFNYIDDRAQINMPTQINIISGIPDEEDVGEVIDAEVEDTEEQKALPETDDDFSDYDYDEEV